MAHTVARTAEKENGLGNPRETEQRDLPFELFGQDDAQDRAWNPRQGDHQGDKLCVHCEVGMQGKQIQHDGVHHQTASHGKEEFIEKGLS